MGYIPGIITHLPKTAKKAVLKGAANGLNPAAAWAGAIGIKKTFKIF
jgi:hypothetical protein